MLSTVVTAAYIVVTEVVKRRFRVSAASQAVARAFSLRDRHVRE